MKQTANVGLIGMGGSALANHFATPALCVDLTALQDNIAEMAATIREAGKAMRPHVKAHKCPVIARLQAEAGAVGFSCATLQEMEALADTGFGGLLLTAPSCSLAVARRLAAVAARVPGTLVAVDSPEAIDALLQAGANVGLLIDLNVGQMRTGVDTPEAALSLAGRAQQGGLATQGVQAYYGHLQGIPDRSERLAAVRQVWLHVAAVRGALEQAGHPATIVSGGGTGTATCDAEGPFTELQPGSYVFMDRQYGAVDTGLRLKQSLTVAARVVSAVRPGRVILDAGTKALSTDAGPALVADAPDGLTHAFMGDEHSVVTGDPARLPPIDALVRLVPPHCDPTVNLYDEIHVFDGDRLAAIWPVAGRGH